MLMRRPVCTVPRERREAGKEHFKGNLLLTNLPMSVQPTKIQPVCINIRLKVEGTAIQVRGSETNFLSGPLSILDS